MVLVLDLPHARTVDHEDRHPFAVQAPDLDPAQLAAAHEPEGPQEQILGLEHRRLLSHTPMDCRRRAGLEWDRSR